MLRIAVSLRYTQILAALTMAAFTLAGCGGDAVAPEPPGGGTTGPVALDVAGGADQTAEVGTSLTLPLDVIARAADGAAVAGVRVEWHVATGAGTVDPTASTTDAQGHARTQWTLGTVAGEQQASAVPAEGSSVDFKATALPGAPTELAVPFDSVTLEPGQDSTLGPFARDRYSNPVDAGALIWSSDDPSVATVDNDGVVQGRAPGATVLTARLGSLSARITVLVGYRFTDIVTGAAATCALTATHRLHCWGRNAESQLGPFRAGETCAGAAPCLRTPGLVSDDVAFTAASPGTEHSCGLAVDGTLLCWGTNDRFALGIGENDWHFSTPVPTAVAGGGTYTAVGVSHGFACALGTDGVARCWGIAGSLGTGSATEDADRPTAVAGSNHFTSIAVASASVCALTADGAAWCWGKINAQGQLGTGDRDAHYAPAAVTGGLVFEEIATGASHTCALTTDGTAYCWGSNSHGQLGVNGIVDAVTPTPVQTTERFSAIAAGGTHTCALTTTGAALCWGSNYDGQLGNDQRGSGPPVRQVATSLAFTRIDARADHTCAIATDGRVYCWGANAQGQLGTGDTVNRTVPARVVGQL